MQNSKYLIAFFSITAMFDQECPMVSYAHAAQRNAVRAKLEQHSTVLQCALPKQEVTDIFPHVPPALPAGTLLLYGVGLRQKGPKRLALPRALLHSLLCTCECVKQKPSICLTVCYDKQALQRTDPLTHKYMVNS